MDGASNPATPANFLITGFHGAGITKSEISRFPQTGVQK
jgi:hypothetical protein